MILVITIEAEYLIYIKEIYLNEILNNINQLVGIFVKIKGKSKISVE